MALTYERSTDPVSSGAQNGVLIPTAVVNANLLSETSKAADCFIDQKFSNKLQAFMLGYVNSTISYFGLYK